MSSKPTLLSLRHICAICVFVFFSALIPSSAFSQTAVSETAVDEAKLDPRLVQITQIVKARASDLATSEERLDTPSQDQVYLNFIDQMQTLFYSQDPDELAQVISKFEQSYAGEMAVNLSGIPSLYLTVTELVAANAVLSDIQNAISQFHESGNWFDKYTAFSIEAHLHVDASERQAALQKAQLALLQIPTKPNSHNEDYVTYAKARIISLIAQLHNLQGNSDLALDTSLSYLRLAKQGSDLNDEVDLINNLIFVYGLSRNHEAQLYLSEQLLEIEKTQSSSVPGLSEMRISAVMNSGGRYSEALTYADLSLDRVKHPGVQRVSQVHKAIALAGLERFDEAREIARLSEVNLSSAHMLTHETRQSDLFLAFLLAQSEDTAYATQLFNRQLDVKAQKFFTNNSRDTTAMIAALENSRERQLEREAASAREARLQAMTIDRQRKLNRLLIILTLLLGGVTVGLILFLKSREKLVQKLEVKTVEAASAEKLKTEFLGMISHELRTPLNGIIGISDFLAHYHEDPDIREKTGIILRSGNELLSVVESLTDMARLDAGQLEILPHDTKLSRSLAAVPEPWAEKAKKKGLAFTYFLDPQITEHHLDEDRLIQCLNILLANAISFTDAGRVHLHITANKGPEGRVSGLTAIVADTGQGMSELVQSRLFKPFMQADTSRKRSHMGTGLSLAIAYALVEMMGGRLSVNSREDRGSEFKLDLPLGPLAQDALQTQGRPSGRLAPLEIESLPDVAAKPEAKPKAEAESRVEETPQLNSSVLNAALLDGPHGPRREVFDLMQPPNGMPSLHDVKELVLPIPEQGRQRVLVVDDMSSNRDVLRLILETQGHRCREAADGYAALAAMDRQAFDLVVLDIHMAPMDGVETLRRIRASGKSYANIPVIALTADNAVSTNAACIKAGADLFLTKPVNREELLRAIGHLHRGEGARILSQ